MALTRCYSSGALVDEGFSLDDVDGHLASEHAVVWVDLYAPGGDELQAMPRQLGPFGPTGWSSPDDRVGS